MSEMDQMGGGQHFSKMSKIQKCLNCGYWILLPVVCSKSTATPLLVPKQGMNSSKKVSVCKCLIDLVYPIVCVINNINVVDGVMVNYPVMVVTILQLPSSEPNFNYAGQGLVLTPNPSTHPPEQTSSDMARLSSQENSTWFINYIFN